MGLRKPSPKGPTIVTVCGRKLTDHGRTLGTITCSLLAMAYGTEARAQSETTLIQPAIPDGFDRGRNVSVLARPRPDYDPLGITVNSFNVFPRVDVGVGATNNVFLTNTNTTSDVFAFVNPSFSAKSDWSRHQVLLRGGAQLRRFVDQPRRNENAWNLGALGRLDASESLSITAEGQVARQFESPFSGEVQSNLAVLSSYLRTFGQLRTEYQFGQGRALLVVDRTAFDFNSIKAANGARLDQSARNRHIARVTGQGEYAFTPSLAVYGQLGYSRTTYTRTLSSGLANRGSDAARVIGGVNFDLAGLLRGTIGVGYVQRNYKSALYRDVGGVSVESKLEVFPTELTTVTVAVRRVLEDSSIGSSNAFFDNRASVRIDHELLRNLLLNVTGEIARQNYIDSPARTNTYRVIGGGRYMVSRNFGIETQASYGNQVGNGTGVGNRFSELRGQIGIVLQR
ncbi:outer membrane beta-barrel protein [Sphingomonas sp.]|uniref:outer membrane beta-barrel protein n=1 Tax=Sphingomonas sp. TaxID=28214 RepID=UPI0025E40C50|nr:outer membrane beta-barrel protein [Sphingomonas sp.]